jgi:hypothetical protein
MFNRAEAVWELRLVLEHLEWALCGEMVIRHMRSARGLGDSQLREENRDGLGCHGCAPVGMHGHLSRRDGRLPAGLMEQSLRQGRAFAMDHQPADHLAAEDVQHHIQVEGGPLGWPQPFRDVPGPALIRRCR